MAASADDNYILELETGTDDNDQPIEWEIETHDLRVPMRVFVNAVRLQGYYPATPAAYDVVLRAHDGEETSYRIEPHSSDDVRGHRTMCRVTTGPTLRVKVQGRSVNEDELLALIVEYIRR